MKIGGINFNKSWAKGVTLDQFIAHESHHYTGDPLSREKLTEAYNLLTEEVKDKKPVKKSEAGK